MILLCFSFPLSPADSSIRPASNRWAFLGCIRFVLSLSAIMPFSMTTNFVFHWSRFFFLGWVPLSWSLVTSCQLSWVPPQATFVSWDPQSLRSTSILDYFFIDFLLSCLLHHSGFLGDLTHHGCILDGLALFSDDLSFPPFIPGEPLCLSNVVLRRPTCQDSFCSFWASCTPASFFGRVWYWFGTGLVRVWYGFGKALVWVW